ncbi:MAG: tRNA-dihydrouridine synthase, partial [Rhizobiaceae bacterium]
VTVHGRTRCQFYKGEADWDAIRAVRSAIKVPLVVNGDIRDKTSASQAVIASGADAVMIGRGAYGAPWLPGLISGQNLEECFPNSEFVKCHHETMLSFYGVQSGTRQARKHLGWYLDKIPKTDISTELKRRLMTSFDIGEIQFLIDEIFSIEHDKKMPLRTAA